MNVFWRCTDPACPMSTYKPWHPTETTTHPALFARWQAEAEAKAAGR